MRITPLAEENRYVLHAHHAIVEKPDPENPDVTVEEKGDPDPDAPVFVYKPLDPREKSRWTGKLFGEGQATVGNEAYIDLFEDRLIRVDNLLVGDEPFDKKNANHLRSLELQWQIEVAMAIFSASKLDKDIAGK